MAPQNASVVVQQESVFLDSQDHPPLVARARGIDIENREESADADE
jgi:hypothetical protein